MQNLDALKKEARSKQTSPQRLLELAKMDMQLSRLIAKRKDAPAQVLEELSKNKDVWTRVAVAGNLNTPTKILELLALDHHLSVPKSVARNPNISGKILEKLSCHKHWSVREAVAVQSSLPLHLAIRLAQDENNEVARQVVIVHISQLPVDLLEKLIFGQNEAVRYVIFSSGRISSTVREEVLWKNIIHPRSTLEIAWIKNNELLLHLAKHQPLSVRLLLAHYYKTPTAVLELLSNDSLTDVRREVAANHNTPVHVYEKLMHDQEKIVRSRLAQNLITPTPILQYLSNDPEGEVARKAQHNLEARRIREII